MRIILLGAPGSGKGTLSNILIEKKGYVQISTGDLFREQVQLGTELGKKVESIMKAGEFVPVEITNKILENKLAELKHNDNIIFDGYPRNIEQANYLSTLTNIDKVIEIQVSDDILLKRIVGRWTCPKCKKIFNIYSPDMKPAKEGICDACGAQLTHRADDNKESFAKRMEIFHKSTTPLIDYYKSKGLLVSIDGNGGSADIITALTGILF